MLSKNKMDEKESIESKILSKDIVQSEEDEDKDVGEEVEDNQIKLTKLLDEVKMNHINKLNTINFIQFEYLDDEFNEKYIEIESIVQEINEEGLIVSIFKNIEGNSIDKPINILIKYNLDDIEINEIDCSITDINIVYLDNKSLTDTEITLFTHNEFIEKEVIKDKEVENLLSDKETIDWTISNNEKIDILIQSLNSFQVEKNLEILENRANFILNTLEYHKLDILNNPTINNRIKNKFFNNNNLVPIIFDSMNIYSIPEAPFIKNTRYNYYNLGLEYINNNHIYGSLDILNLLDCYSSTFKYRSRNKPGCYLKNCPKNNISSGDSTDLYYYSDKSSWNKDFIKKDISFSSEYRKQYKTNPGLMLSFIEYQALRKRGGIFSLSKDNDIHLNYGLDSNYINSLTDIHFEYNNNIFGNDYSLFVNNNLYEELDTPLAIDETHILEDSSNEGIAKKILNKHNLELEELSFYHIKDGTNSNLFGYRYSDIEGVFSHKNSLSEFYFDIKEEYYLGIDTEFKPIKRYIDGPNYLYVDRTSKDNIVGKVCDGTSTKMEIILKEKIGKNKAENWVKEGKDYSKKIIGRSKKVKYLNGEDIYIGGFIWNLKEKELPNNFLSNEKITIPNSENILNADIDYFQEFNINIAHFLNNKKHSLNRTTNKNKILDENLIEFQPFNNNYILLNNVKEQINDENDFLDIVRKINPNFKQLISSQYILNEIKNIYNIDDLDRFLSFYNISTYYDLSQKDIKKYIYPIINKNISKIDSEENYFKNQIKFYSNSKSKIKLFIKELLVKLYILNDKDITDYIKTTIETYTLEDIEYLLIFTTIFKLNKKNKIRINNKNNRIINDFIQLNKIDLKTFTNVLLNYYENLDNSILYSFLYFYFINKYPKYLFENTSYQHFIKYSKATEDNKFKHIMRTYYDIQLPYFTDKYINSNENILNSLTYRIYDKIKNSIDNGVLFHESFNQLILNKSLLSSKKNFKIKKDIESKLEEIQRQLTQVQETLDNEIEIQPNKCNNLVISKTYYSYRKLILDNDKNIINYRKIKKMMNDYKIFKSIIENNLKEGIILSRDITIDNNLIIYNKFLDKLKHSYPFSKQSSLNSKITDVYKIYHKNGILGDKYIDKIQKDADDNVDIDINLTSTNIFIQEGDYCILKKPNKNRLFKRTRDNKWEYLNKTTNSFFENEFSLCNLDKTNIPNIESNSCYYNKDKCIPIDLYNLFNIRETLEITKENYLTFLKNITTKTDLKINMDNIKKQIRLNNNKISNSFRNKLIQKDKQIDIDLNILAYSYILYINKNGYSKDYIYDLLDTIYNKIYSLNETYELDSSNEDILTFDDWIKVARTDNEFVEYAQEELNTIKKYRKLLNKVLLISDKDYKYSQLKHFIQKYAYIDNKFDDIYWNLPNLNNKNLFFYKMTCKHNIILSSTAYLSSEKKDLLYEQLYREWGNSLNNKIYCKHCGTILSEDNTTDEITFDEDTEKAVTNIEISSSIAEMEYDMYFMDRFSDIVKEYYNNFIKKYTDEYLKVTPSLENKDIKFILEYYNEIEIKKLNHFPNFKSYFEYFKQNYRTDNIVKPNKKYINKIIEKLSKIISKKFKVKETYKEKTKNFLGNLNNNLNKNCVYIKLNEKNIEKISNFVENVSDFDNFNAIEFLLKTQTFNVDLSIICINLNFIIESYEVLRTFYFKTGFISRFIFTLFTSINPNYNISSTGQEQTGKLILPPSLNYNIDIINLKTTCIQKNIDIILSQNQKIFINSISKILTKDLNRFWIIPNFDNENKFSQTGLIEYTIKDWLMYYICDKKLFSQFRDKIINERCNRDIIYEDKKWIDFKPPFNLVTDISNTSLEIMTQININLESSIKFKVLDKIRAVHTYPITQNYYNSFNDIHLNNLILNSYIENYSTKNIYNTFFYFEPLSYKTQYKDELTLDNIYEVFNVNNYYEIIKNLYNTFCFGEIHLGKKRIFKSFTITNKEFISNLFKNKIIDSSLLDIDPISNQTMIDKLEHIYDNKNILEIEIDLVSNKSKIEINLEFNKLIESKTKEECIELLQKMKTIIFLNNKLHYDDNICFINPNIYTQLNKQTIYYKLLENLVQFISNIIDLTKEDEWASSLNKYLGIIIERSNIIHKIINKTIDFSNISEEDKSLLKTYNIINVGEEFKDINIDIIYQINLYIFNKSSNYKEGDDFILFDFIKVINSNLECPNEDINMFINDYIVNNDLTKLSVEKINNICKNLIINNTYDELEVNEIKNEILNSFDSEFYNIMTLSKKKSSLIKLNIIQKYTHTYLINVINDLKQKINILVKTNSIYYDNNINNIYNNFDIILNTTNDNYQSYYYSPFTIFDIINIYKLIFTIYLKKIILSPLSETLKDHLYKLIILNTSINYTTESDIDNVINRRRTLRNEENIKNTENADENVREFHQIARSLNFGNFTQLSKDKYNLDIKENTQNIIGDSKQDVNTEEQVLEETLNRQLQDYTDGNTIDLNTLSRLELEEQTDYNDLLVNDMNTLGTLEEYENNLLDEEEYDTR